ncbi:lysophospholipase [Pleurotus eryngii]|uniref:Lysophospholipase n=1 Tax=Pleurotus eryngii TaxID=5323 RepID=A0A9P6A7G3_PLEER|nr:lysophospholipase [Pleurotus eryngii]
MAEFVEAWLAGPNATQFYTRTYPAASPKAVVVFLHGFAEHIGRYTHIHPRLAQNGVAVFAFDLRGFGKTAQDIEKKSPRSSYGKTSWPENFADIEWGIKHVRKEYPGVPVFLMGHSMGAALALGFVTRNSAPPDPEIIKSLSGVISQSPLVHQTYPASKALRWVGGKASMLAPSTLIPAPVKAEHLSHDDESNTSYLKDPLIKPSGSLKGIHDMLTGGEQLLEVHYKHWPESLPVYIVHGSEDKVTCPKASKAFHDKISAHKKQYELIEGGFHELQNEPDGVKEKVYDGIIAFIEAHLGVTPKL